MLDLQKKDDVNPVCPHCESELTRLCYRSIVGGFLSKRFVYFCPECDKVLGVSHRTGFFWD